MYVSKLGVAMICTAMVVLTGCTGDDSRAHPIDDDRPTPTPAPTPFDPPLSFDTTAARPLPESASHGGGKLPLILHRTIAFVATPKSVEVVNLVDGTVVRTVRPSNYSETPDDSNSELAPFMPPLFREPIMPPFLTRMDGRDTVLAAFEIKVDGVGTARDTAFLELIALDADTGDDAWTAQVALEDGVAAPWVVGVSGATVIVGHGSGVLAVDSTSQEIVWRHDSMVPAAVIDQTIVGIVHTDIMSSYIAGLSAADGAERWMTERLMESAVTRVGPLVVVTGKRYFDAVEFFHMVVPDTGQLLHGAEGRGYASYRCAFDDMSTILCMGGSLGSPELIYAVDVSTPDEILWILPDEDSNRFAPIVRTVWHGIAYSYNAYLDIRTGVDKIPDPPVVPLLVNEYFAVVELDTAESGRTLVVVPAVG